MARQGARIIDPSVVSGYTLVSETLMLPGELRQAVIDAFRCDYSVETVMACNRRRHARIVEPALQHAHDVGIRVSIRRICAVVDLAVDQRPLPDTAILAEAAHIRTCKN